jgi:hypothetical protein
MELTFANAHILLDGLLLGNKIKISLKKSSTPAWAVAAQAFLSWRARSSVPHAQPQYPQSTP